MDSLVIRSSSPWLPDWALSVGLLVFGVVAALAAHQLLHGIAKRFAEKHGLFARALVQRTAGPARLALVIVGVSVAASVAPMSTAGRDLLRHTLLIGFIVLVGWAAVAALHVWSVVYTRQFRVDVEDNLVARKHLTQVRILERTAAVFIMLLTIGGALMTLDAVRQYGVTVLASAGAAGIIAGLALQPLLTNLIAGIQIAVTQPIRIDDAVIVEGEWGWIEEIKSTFVVVRLWDLRRMILPLTYFMQKPFQNWTRESASLIGTAMFYVDYSAPIDAMRQKLGEIAKASPKWDGKVVNLAVTELTERTMQVRCLVSARNAGETFDLRCEVREKMVAWLRQQPGALPRERMTLDAPLPERSPGDREPVREAEPAGAAV